MPRWMHTDSEDIVELPDLPDHLFEPPVFVYK